MDWASVTDEVIMDLENMSHPLHIVEKELQHVWPRECHPNPISCLIAEVKRLRKELDEVYQERDKYDGALNIALEHLGYQGADHEWFCKEKYQCNVYGDDLEEEE